MSHVLWNFMFKGIRVSAHLGTVATEEQLFVSFWQYFPHSSDCFPHSFSSQEFRKTSLENKYHSLPCDFGIFVGKTHHSCKSLGHSRPNSLSSILHFAKVTVEKRAWPPYRHKWGTVGFVLTPRSRPDGRTPEIPENSGKNPEKTNISWKSGKLHVISN